MTESMFREHDSLLWVWLLYQHSEASGWPPIHTAGPISNGFQPPKLLSARAMNPTLFLPFSVIKTLDLVFLLKTLFSSTLDLSCFFLFNSELCFSPWLWFTPIEMILGCVEKNQLQWSNKVEEDWGGKRHSTMSFTSQVPSLSSPLTSARLSSWFILKVYPHGCKVAASPVASHFYPTTEEGKDKERLWAPIWGKSLKFPG